MLLVVDDQKFVAVHEVCENYSLKSQKSIVWYQVIFSSEFLDSLRKRFILV